MHNKIWMVRMILPRINPLEKSIHGMAANESDKQKIGTK